MTHHQAGRDQDGTRVPRDIKGLRLLFFRIILVLMPVIILAFIELLLRITGVGREIPLFVEDPGHENQLMINPEVARRYFLDPAAAPGVQYPPFRKEKPGNSFRVVVQGASTVAGIPYKKGGAFPSMLEQRLRNSIPGKEIEVINTGITAVCSYTLLDLADDIIDIDPDVVIIYAGHNEYYGVLGIGSSQRLGKFSGLIRFYLAMNRFRLVQLVRKAHAALAGRKTAGIISRPNSTLMERMVREREIPFGSDLYARGVDQFRVNMSKLAGTYRKHGIPVFICTLVSNIKDLHPFLGKGSPAGIFPVDPGNADDHYNLGRKYYLDGDYEQAGYQFSLARDYDMLRFRAPSVFNDIIGKVASEQGARLVDIEGRFKASSMNGIIGNELITEHVHPNIQGYFLMADECYRALYESGLVPDWEIYIPAESARMNLPVTEVDSIYGLIGIRMLTHSWPFTDQSPDKSSAADYFTPENYVDSLAYALFVEQISWGEAMNRLYQHYLSEGAYGRALNVAHALQIEMKNTGIPYNMAARIYSAMGMPDQAASALQKGFRIEPMPQIAYNLGNSLIRSGRPGESVPYLEYFLQYYPGRKDVAQKVATVRALVDLQSQIHSFPDSTELYVYAAYRYLQLDQWHIADSLIRVAHRLDPHNDLVNQVLKDPGKEQP